MFSLRPKERTWNISTLKNLSQNLATKIDEKTHQNLILESLKDFQKTIH